MALWARIPALLCLVLLSINAGAAQLLDNRGCIAQFVPNTNYFSTAFVGEPFALPIASLGSNITNAYNFTVQYDFFYKVVRDTHANTTYILYLCGSNTAMMKPPPNNGMFPVPITDFGMVTDVPANFLQLLGVVGSLKKIDLGPVVDPCMQKAAESLSPDPAFNGPMIDGMGPQMSTTGQPMAYGKPNISFSATQDPGILSRAEWIKYLALYFNKEDLAQSVFTNISSAYQCLNGSAPASEPKPVVAWLSYYDGSWTLSRATYKKQLVADAGGTDVPDVGTGDVTFSMSSAADVAAFKSLLQTVDVVMDETFLPQGPPQYSLSNFTTNAQLTSDDVSSLKFLASGSPNIWSIYGTWAPRPLPSTAWFESAVSQPQVVLEELLAILHPSMFPKGLSHTFLYNIANGAAKEVTSADCSADPAALVPPTAVSCFSKSASNNPQLSKSASSVSSFLPACASALLSLVAVLLF